MIYIDNREVTRYVGVKVRLHYARIRDSWFVIRDSRFVAIHENSLSNRMDPNDEWRMWTNFLSTLFANYIRITNYA